MKLGLSSYACAWEVGLPGFEPERRLDAAGLIARANSLGLSLVQIADNIALQHAGRDELKEVRERARECGVQVELGTRGIGRDHVRRFLDLCEMFESPMLRIVVDTANHHPPVPEIAEILGGLMSDFRAARVTLALENHDRFDSRTFANLIEQLGADYAGICLDTVNSFGALEGPGVVIETLAPYVVNLHLKDFVIHRHTSMMGFEITGAPAGKGRLDVPALLAALRSHGRDPNAILELWPAPEGTIDRTIEKERQWVIDSVGYLRTLIPN